MEKKLLLKIENIGKVFGSSTVALKDACMEVYAGEIVGLVGENGAGKSTLLKIIMGVQPQSSGTMTWCGKPYAPKTPREANEAGIGMVFQEQSLVTNLTVGQNIFLGFEKQFSSCGIVNFKKMYAAAEKVLQEVGLSHIKPETYVRDLPFATRQMVEIAKAINLASSGGTGHALVLLDEPTSVLNDEELQQLYRQMRHLSQLGHAIIFVSHRLDEILEITDRIYVFKDAQNAGEFQTESTREIDLYAAMVGQSDVGEYYDTASQRTPDEEVVLSVESLSEFGAFRDVSFSLHRGEILGICGVIGSGKEELCYALCGDTGVTEGTITVKGQSKAFSNPADAKKMGIIMVPQERNVEGVFPITSISENIAASNMNQLAKAGFLRSQSVKKQALEWISRLKIRTKGPSQPVNTLSGGNAQKVVFARIMASNCDILLLNHPTRGVDVGAKVEIYALIRDIVKQGCSVILLGDTLDECIGLSNRILVMKDGVITAEFDAPPGRKPTNLQIIEHMM